MVTFGTIDAYISNPVALCLGGPRSPEASGKEDGITRVQEGCHEASTAISVAGSSTANDGMG